MTTQKKWKRSHRDVNLYFEGYEKRITADPITGKSRTEYQYTGDYYIFRITQNRFKRYKLISALTTLGGTVFFVAACALGPLGSIRPYMGIPALLSLIPLCYLLLGLWVMLRDGKPRMTIREYVFGIGRMKNTLWCVLALWAITLMGHVVYIVSHKDFSALELGCGVLELAALVLLSVQWRVLEELLTSCIHRAKSKYDKQSGQPEEGVN